MTDSRLRVYVAGPLTGPNPKTIYDNIERAEKVGVDVIKAGHLPVVPHSLSQGVHEQHTAETGTELSWEWWMQFCERELATCDVLLCYDRSPGADREVAHAIALGIPVIDSVYKLAGIGRGDAA